MLTTPNRQSSADDSLFALPSRPQGDLSCSRPFPQVIQLYTTKGNKESFKGKIIYSGKIMKFFKGWEIVELRKSVDKLLIAGN
jgi:hypothetical protein